eukprot:5592930-Amphidinium_carterae.1
MKRLIGLCCSAEIGSGASLNSQSPSSIAHPDAAQALEVACSRSLPVWAAAFTKVLHTMLVRRTVRQNWDPRRLVLVSSAQSATTLDLMLYAVALKYPPFVSLMMLKECRIGQSIRVSLRLQGSVLTLVLMDLPQRCRLTALHAGLAATPMQEIALRFAHAFKSSKE